MRLERIEEIEAYVKKEGTVSSDTLCEVFQISKNTLRRDLNYLVERGNIAKVYGGVTAIRHPDGTTVRELVSFNDRTVQNIELKERVARKAVSHIQSGDTVFIDSGTSTLSIINHISHLEQLTVITNSVQFMYRALNHPNIHLIGLPGTMNRATASLVGGQCRENLMSLNISKAFMACTALSIGSGVTNATSSEYEIKKVVISRSQEHILLTDHTKFDKTSLMTFARLTDFQTIITDEQPSKEYVEYFQAHGIQLELA